MRLTSGRTLRRPINLALLLLVLCALLFTPFQGRAETLTIGGQVTGTADCIASVAIDGGEPLGSIQTDSKGNYQFSGVPSNPNGSFKIYDLKPSKSGCGFDPQSISIWVYDKNVTVNFVSRRTYTLCGTVWDGSLSVKGVGIDRTSGGKFKESTLTNDTGRYCFLGLEQGSDYTVSASKRGYRFDPEAVSGLINGDSYADFQVSSKVVTYIISGRITSGGSGLAGVNITVPGSGATSTDSNGDYEIGGFKNGSYTIKPVLIGHVFDPSSKNVKVRGTDLRNVDFVEKLPKSSSKPKKRPSTKAKKSHHRRSPHRVAHHVEILH